MVCLMLLYRSVESLRRNLTNLTLMKVGGFPLAADQEARVRVPSKSAFSRFRKLLKRMEFEHGAMCALFYRNCDQLMLACQDFIQTVLKQLTYLDFKSVVDLKLSHKNN